MVIHQKIIIKILHNVIKMFINFDRKEYIEMIEYISAEVMPEDIKDNKKKMTAFKNRAKSFIINESSELSHYDANKHLTRIVFPSDKLGIQSKLKYIKKYHEIGHIGRDRLISLISSKIYGFKREDVMHVINCCAQCQLRHLMTTKPEIRPIIAKYPRDRFLADLIDFRYYSNLNDGYGWALVIIDSFSKFACVVPCKKKTAIDVKDAFEKIFCIIGSPIILHTDNGKEFKNSLILKMCEQFDIKSVHGRPRCPWVQGQVERLNGTLKFMLSTTADSEDIRYQWTKVLSKVVYTYNMVIHSTTKKRPFDLFMSGIFSKKNDAVHVNSLSAKNAEYIALGQDDIEDLDQSSTTSDNLIRNLEDLEKPKDCGEINSNSELKAIEIKELEMMGEEARTNTLIAAEKMKLKRKWKNDFLPISIGDEVFYRPDLDKINPGNRILPLGDHIDRNIYIISDIIYSDMVNLISKDDETVEKKRINTRNIRHVKKLFDNDLEIN
jgi:transposase InsO family protein